MAMAVRAGWKLAADPKKRRCTLPIPSQASLAPADPMHLRRPLLLLALGLLLCGCPEQVNAQIPDIDSLRTLLKTDGRTTDRVDHLIALAFALSDKESYTESAGLLAEANALAVDLQYKVGMAYAPLSDANRYLKANRYPEAIAAFKDCIVRLDAAGVEQGMSSPLGTIRSIYNAAGLQQERFEFYRDALERYRRKGQALNAAICEHGLGGYYMSARQYGQAIEHYMKAREGLEKTDPSNAANETMVIGWCYQLWGNPDRAEPFLREALEAFLREKNIDQAMTCVLNLGDLELGRGDTLKALQHYRGSRRYWNDITLIRVATLRSHLAMVFIGMGELDSARAELDALNALHAKNPLPLSNTFGECEVDYVNYLFQKAIGQPALADGYLERALNDAVRLSSMPLILKYRKELSDRYLERGDATNAAIQAQAYIRLNDSLQAESNSSSISVYEGQVKERESAVELQKQKLVRNGFMGGFLLVALFALVFLFQRNRISKERKRSDELLLNILPEEVAEELKAKGEADAKQIDEVTVIFTDFKGFTAMSEQLTPKELVRDIHECFSAFDRIMEKHGIEKIKTIGDAYMAAGGLPTPNTTHALDVVKAALEIRDFIAEGKARKVAAGLPYFEIRIGIHTGPVVAGIVGVKKFAYDIWGDTVNIASRMESSGEVGRVNISESTYALVKDVQKVNGEWSIANGGSTHSPTPIHHSPAFVFTPRGKVQAKGKGEMEMYFVSESSI